MPYWVGHNFLSSLVFLLISTQEIHWKILDFGHLEVPCYLSKSYYWWCLLGFVKLGVMGDSLDMLPVMETEEDLIAAVEEILKAVELRKDWTDEARRILANLGSRLCDISRIREIDDDKLKEGEGLDDLEQQLNEIQDKIMNWEKEQSMIWDCGPEEAYEYLKAVDEVRKLIEMMEGKNLNNSMDDLAFLHRAHDILQTAMSRLEEEFKILLVQNRQPFEPEYMSFRSNEEDIIDAGSVISSGDDSVEDLDQRESMGRASEDYIIELVHPDVIRDLKSIAHLMHDSNYGRECTQAFINVQKDTLNECLSILDMEKLSIEDVLKMEWNGLNSKIRRWIRAVKIFVRVYLASEKFLTDQIFGEVESLSSVCFVELSKTAILQLLNFGEAIAIGPHQPEKLMRILDMYEVLADLIPDIASLYSDEAGSCIRTECEDVQRRLGDCAKATFIEFEKAVALNPSNNPFSGGRVHPLTRYVLNYTKTLTDYSKTLDVILQDGENDNPASVSPASSPISEEEENVNVSSCPSPMVVYFRSLISNLESNLDEKSKLYKDEALRHLFLTNNIHYIAKKVKESELRTVLGDDWIRRRNWRFQQHAMNYERATWSSILTLLRDEGIQHPVSHSISRTILKEKLQSFYLAFEEVYKNQTGWSVRDIYLREDLRISSLRVIQAYRTFIGRHSNHISEKHIKYTADDLERLLLDLFEGSQKYLHGGHKKLS